MPKQHNAWFVSFDHCNVYLSTIWPSHQFAYVRLELVLKICWKAEDENYYTLIVWNKAIVRNIELSKLNWKWSDSIELFFQLSFWSMPPNLTSGNFRTIDNQRSSIPLWLWSYSSDLVCFSWSFAGSGWSISSVLGLAQFRSYSSCLSWRRGSILLVKLATNRS